MDNKKKTGKIAVIMGSQSDFATMRHASSLLEQFGINYVLRIISAHRTPHRLYQFAKDIEREEIDIIIAGAGGAAHLPGMMAALTSKPVLGVPVESKILRGEDSLLSIVQMPAGVPVATFAIGPSGAVNAALFAIAMLALNDAAIEQALAQYRRQQSDNVAFIPS